MVKKSKSIPTSKINKLPNSNRALKMMEDNFVNTVVSLYNENNWEKILQLNADSKSEIAKKLLWVWPSTDNLNFIKNIVDAKGLEGIISIGCGSGLFEWFLQKYTNLPVIGYEVNREWWTSKYSPPQFIRLEFLDMPPKGQYLKHNYALLFCYFNNGPAFSDYVEEYQGNLIFIIGPAQGQGRHTNPAPFTPNLNTFWQLYDFQEVKDTKDFIAAYVR